MTATDRPYPPRHYPTPAAKCADLVVHVMGLTLALVGGIVLLTLAVRDQSLSKAVAVGIYAVGLLAMLGFSTAYNFAKPEYRPVLRRLDHAGIFLMIAGSYTPFTTQHLTGAWAWGMTSAVWATAVFAALAKLFLPGLGKGFWIIVYLALGWLMVIAVQPIMQSLGLPPLILMAVGGLLYSVGVIFYANKAMRYRRAIWHGHVVVAAAVHWVAVLLAVLK